MDNKHPLNNNTASADPTLTDLNIVEDGVLEAGRRQSYLALGSNIGAREQLLRRALRLLDNDPGIQVMRISGIYETAPVGYTDQPAFLNMVAAVRTTLEPIALLRTMLNIENKLGRTREIRFGPRTIDLDLLLMEDIRMEDEELTLPHPRMLERAFVMVPLNDVLDSRHPLKKQADQLASRALEDGGEGITLWNTINWHNASELSES
ncbi:2-amino-4-hydroxy-6-hydroxymethyldihydropteridine diphosphokinase [Paenibacillus nasutitermitis]|uniref:2-amino-4-hydroxy-6-hydroxymethyldihydropteridine diphosphokinase n=1 Tax=Paenibacillus nasutitermitis TaxID=1652958 RepID=A0A917E4F4_9BACL|nr:2-amino-4-hydroxy-6-hydroxymethyldihydropteridine diphosphokinase [Paenibacillus nasutitermitis]GGD99805.1 2-amino-4-hydroxy-6-hydroxymethyldihydropteridine diphosphokinase [Paenibacillus nasutitermitis]